MGRQDRCARSRQVGRHHRGQWRSAEGHYHPAACLIRDEVGSGVQERDSREVKATRFEFRFRLAISTIIYVIGFCAPWLRFGHAAETNPTLLWSWLAIELARIGVLSAQNAYLLITLV